MNEYSPFIDNDDEKSPSFGELKTTSLTQGLTLTYIQRIFVKPIVLGNERLTIVARFRDG